MKKSNLLILLIGAVFTFAVVFTINNTKRIDRNLATAYERAAINEGPEKDDPWARIAYETRRLVDPATGKIPDNIRQKEMEFAKNLQATESGSLSKTNTSTWALRGPINRGGRTRALGIDIRTQGTSGNTIIAGGVSGGIWKSTDDGSTWTNKLSPAVIHSTTCIAQDTRSGHQDTWYVGTGEFSGSANGGGGAYFRGDGVFKSTDNGESWTLLSSTSDGNVQSFSSYWRYVTNIAVNPVNGDVYAATTGNILKSTDGGTNWTTSIGSGAGTSTPADVQITSTGVVYAGIPSSMPDAGIYRTPDGGTTWTNIKPTSFPTYARVVIAIDPNNENVVYYWVYTGVAPSGTALWKYTYPGSGTGAGDGNWVNLTSKLPTGIGGLVGNLNVQGGYDMVMKVQPGNSNLVVIGGTNLYRTTDGFATQIGAAGWIGGYATANNVSQYANQHPDQHSFVFLASPNSAIAYSGHDGGLSKTTNIAATTVAWSNLNTGYVTSQFYSISIDESMSGDPAIAGGMQDNGNYYARTASYNDPWVEWPHGGDGGYSAIKNNGSGYTIYFETQNSGFLRRMKYNTSGTLLSSANIRMNYSVGSSQLFINPFVVDPNDFNIMYICMGDSVWRNSNLSNISDNNSTNTSVGWQVLSNTPAAAGQPTALAVSKASPANRLYYGTSSGQVWKMDNANTGDPTATNITGAGFPSGYVSCIAVDQADANKVFVVFSNYEVKSLWASTDGGSTWSDVSGNLEQNTDGSGNGPSCRWATYYDNGSTTTFFVATSTGLYSTTNLNGTSTVWTQEGATSIGNVVCDMVVARQSDGKVVVGTHGTGVYSTTVSTGIESETSSIPTSYALNQNYPNPFNPSTKIKFSLPSSENVKLTIYDITGRKVRELVNQDLSAGVHTVDFNASNLASGTYIYRIQAGSYVQSKKMILMK